MNGFVTCTSGRKASGGADGGVDLILFNRTHNTNEAVQIKHYQASGRAITVKEIRELNSAKRNHNCALARFIATSTFTNPALVEADKFHIECHNKDWAKNRVEKWQKAEAAKKTS